MAETGQTVAWKVLEMEMKLAGMCAVLAMREKLAGVWEMLVAGTEQAVMRTEF